MLHLECEIHKIINESQTSADLFRRLYLHKKSKDKKFSIQYLCNKIGVRSKGHVSFMMNGSRKIYQHHLEALITLFKLTQSQEDDLRSRYMNHQCLTEIKESDNQATTIPYLRLS